MLEDVRARHMYTSRTMGTKQICVHFDIFEGCDGKQDSDSNSGSDALLEVRGMGQIHSPHETRLPVREAVAQQDYCWNTI